MKNAVINHSRAPMFLNWFFYELVILTSLCGFCFCAETPPHTHRIIEHDVNKDGIVDYRVETILRGKEKIYISMQKRISDERWETVRSYLVGGEISVIEEDENSDGIFETKLVFSNGRKALEVFLRKNDGTIEVCDKTVQESYRTQFEVMDGFWQMPIDAKNDKAVEKLLIETKDKIENAKKDRLRINK